MRKFNSDERTSKKKKEIPMKFKIVRGNILDLTDR